MHGARKPLDRGDLFPGSSSLCVDDARLARSANASSPYTDSPYCVRIRQWDTAHFGFVIGSMDRNRTSNDSMGSALARAMQRGVRCIYCVTPENDDLNVVDERFDRVEVKLDLTARVPSAGSPYTLARAEDYPPLRELARRAFRGQTRFYNDRNFPEDKADSLYEKWVDRGKHEENAHVIVVEGARTDGFSVVRTGRNESRIELIAVSKPARGKGIGTKLIQGSLAVAREHGHDSINVETQSDNEAALALYRKMGFWVSSRRATWHWWNA